MKSLKLFLVTLLMLVSSASMAAELCAPLFVKPPLNLQYRSSLIGKILYGDQAAWVKDFKANPDVIYTGKHDYVPGSEFLASNEFDWAKTPFSRKKSDLLVAFATNTAWEIMIAQSPKNVVIADWSPNPLMAQAYIITPLMKLAKSPQEFVTLLSGKKPSPGIETKPMDQILREASEFTALNPLERGPKVRELLDYLLAREEIGDKELEFLASYFMATAGMTPATSSFGPFTGLRNPGFANFVKFYDARYLMHQSTVSKELGALTNAENFAKLRSYYTEGRIKYAVTSVTDMQFYSTIIRSYQPQGLNNMILSVSNIFDCGGYNGLTFQHYQALLKSVAQELNVSEGGRDLTVYRTTNDRPPHGFYRYEIDHINKIPKLDEFDSQALQGPKVDFDILKPAM